MKLDWLQACMQDGTPVYRLDGHPARIYKSSIETIIAQKHAVYLILHDGMTINTKNFGTVAFWSECEARKAVTE